MKKTLIALGALMMGIITVAAISGCSANNNPHDLCDCDEKIAQLETENSELNDRVDALESQVADLMTTTTVTTTTTTTTTTEEAEEKTTAATTKSTTKAQGGGGGKKTTKATTKATTAAPTTAKPTSAPTNSDGFGTDVGM